ncbi:MAG: hypothetical protein IJC01_00400 [Clostridia bacterium]|nr:hypothetical protein [Clostridia bacterium]
MKKNRFLKTAGALLILCLLTTCVIGTTFAKYVTSGGTSDSARVARWGVQLTMAANDELFDNEYTNGIGEVTVRAASDKLVAPGTTQNTAAVFNLSGTPEVAVKITINLAIYNEVVLKAGTYENYTTAVAGDNFTLDYDYYPVVFTLRQTTEAGAPVNIPLATGNLTTIKNFLDSFNSDLNRSYCPPNTNLESTFELTWAWAFNGDDRCDTYLANQAAGSSSTDYNTQVGFGITITVEQVD